MKVKVKVTNTKTNVKHTVKIYPVISHKTHSYTVYYFILISHTNKHKDYQMH